MSTVSAVSAGVARRPRLTLAGVALGARTKAFTPLGPVEPLGPGHAACPPRRQTNQRPSRISSRSGSSITSRQAWMRRRQMRNQRYEVASPRGSKPVRAANRLPRLPRQRVDLQDLDFAIDHGRVAGVAQHQPNGGGGGQVPAGRAAGRRGHQQRLAVPVEGQRHQVRRTVRRGTYRARIVTEGAFDGFKHWRGLATRYDKHAIVYRGGLVPGSRAALAHRLGRHVPGAKGAGLVAKA
jgi:hypothetical protein